MQPLNLTFSFQTLGNERILHLGTKSNVSTNLYFASPLWHVINLSKYGWHFPLNMSGIYSSSLLRNYIIQGYRQCRLIFAFFFLEGKFRWRIFHEFQMDREVRGSSNWETWAPQGSYPAMSGLLFHIIFWCRLLLSVLLHATWLSTLTLTCTC